MGRIRPDCLSGPSGRAGLERVDRWLRRLGGMLRSTSTRNFLIVPLAVIAEQGWSRRRLHPRWVMGSAAGYLLYWSSGRYRVRRGGGGPGIANPPLSLVTTGPYGLTRNPMYLGHVVFLVSLNLATRSPWALAYGTYSLPWFNRRVRADEERLAALFGDEYLAYVRRVPRWLGLPRPTEPTSIPPHGT